MISKITATMVADDWQACYNRDLVFRLFLEDKTPLEVLTLNTGEWKDVPPQDRLWVVLREAVLPDELMRLFACWCAEQELPRYEMEYPGDTRLRDAIIASRGYVFGSVDAAAWSAAESAARSAAGSAAESAAESAARSAAWSAAWSAVRSAAGSAAESAAWSAAWSAARSAARSAAGSAAESAAWSAAWSAARSAQAAKLVKMVRIWAETGDVYGGEVHEKQGVKA